ncbi:MAG: hypothetical protein COA58_08955 [Bacteroidetes bacterium]|nr:MAG: hypothetical protein COA58_08955 [Bacteroidota bacterium]
MIDDIYKRAKLLSKTCLKIALVLPPEITMCNLMRGHLIDRATNMAIKAKGLMVTQNPDYFLKKLSEAKESCDGCAYWLELIKDENYLESDIINPILEESEAISYLFAMAIKKIKPNY